MSFVDKEVKNFIETIIADDLKSGKHKNIITRFPPEPNGYFHIGHCKSICLNFGLAEEIEGAVCNLRFDDTNPEKEKQEYVDAIMEDIKWLGFDWEDRLYHSSDYFDKLYGFAVELIEKGLAYVDSQTPEQVRENRGTMTEPGKNSPDRDRSVEENLKLFAEMKDGKYKDGELTLRAKCDMSSPNIIMRDPIIYRIKHASHQRTGDKWCIYPMYDFTHCLSDALEHITHSLCTLEFENNREIYDWLVDNVSVPAKPRQYEFARLSLNYTVMSKRLLLQLVEEKHVSGWDDPRMPTIRGMRRRGYTPEGIKNFCDYIGVGKKNTVIDYGLLEQFVRDDLGTRTKRCMGVLEPIKVTLTNWDQDVIDIEAPFHPKDESYGTRTLKLGKTLYIDASDFLEEPPPPKKWFRLGPDRTVRLRYGPMITCDEFVKDGDGNIIELKCRYIEDSFGGKTPEGVKKAKGIIHWVSGEDAADVEVRMYDRLFKVENPLADKSVNFLEHLNAEAGKTLTAKVEPAIAGLAPGESVQFERMGYFIADSVDSKPGTPVFNRTVALKDSWAKQKPKQ